VINYFKYEVTINYQSVVESPVEFPAVTVCNLNPFNTANQANTSVYLANILTEKGISAEAFSSRLNATSTTAKSMFVVSHASNLLKAAIMNDKSLSASGREMLSFTLGSMLISCYFNGVECNETDFSWLWSFEYGNCYTFNGAEDRFGRRTQAKMTSKAGPHNGLTLELFVGSPGIQDVYLIKSGAHVIVHNRTTKPLTKYEGVDVKVSSATSIAIARTIYAKKEAPYSDCRANVEQSRDTDSLVFKQTLSSGGGKYTQKYCYEVCFQMLFVSGACNCSDPSVPYFFDASAGADPARNRTGQYCSTIEDFECLKKIRLEFDVNKTFSSICKSHCPLECYSVYYSTSSSEANYPSDFYASMLSRQKNFLDKFSFDQSSQSTYSSSGRWGDWGSIFNRSNVTNADSIVGGVLLLGEQANSSETNPEANDVNILEALNTQQQLEMISSSTLLLSLYYDDLRYTVIQDNEAITPETLVGVIGNLHFILELFLFFCLFFAFLALEQCY
jgi:hypothetical protein